MAFKHGHYIDSGLSIEERERRLQEAKAESDKLKSWDDVPETFEDQDDDQYYAEHNKTAQ